MKNTPSLQPHPSAMMKLRVNRFCQEIPTKHRAMTRTHLYQQIILGVISSPQQIPVSNIPLYYKEWLKNQRKEAEEMKKVIELASTLGLI